MQKSQVQTPLFKEQSEEQLYQPFKQSPSLIQIQQHVRSKTELLDISDVSYEEVKKKKSQNKLKVLGILQVDRVVQSFKRKLMQKAQVLDFQKRKKIEQIIKENFIEQKITQNQNISKVSSNCYIKVLDSDSGFFLLWNCIEALSYFLILWFYPIIWSYEIQQNEFTGLRIYLECFVIINSAMQLNKSIIFQGQIISNRIQIAKMYAKNDLIFDLILIFSILKIDYSITQENINQILFAFLVCLLCLVSFLKVNELIQKLQLLSNFSLINKEYSELIKLFLSIMSFAHIMACFWYYIGNLSLEYYQTNWLIVKQIENESTFIKYSYSYYWATVTMITVGYGDITPQNTFEIIACIIMMFMACGMFGFSLNKVGLILQNIQELKSSLQQSIITLTMYMKQHNVPSSLQNRIRNYIQYSNSEKMNQEKSIIPLLQQSLSQNLRNELMFKVFQHLLREEKWFYDQFSQESLENISKKLTTYYYQPDEFIYQKGQIDDNSIYFIDHGQVKLCDQNSQTQITIIKQGQKFGEYSFFTQQQRETDCVSLSFTKVYKIKRSDFLQSLTKKDQEQFNFIKDKIIQNIPLEGIKCIACQSNQHLFQNCNVLFYFPNINKLIKQSNISIDSTRQQFLRNNFKINTFNYHEEIIKQQKQLLEQYSKLDKTIISTEKEPDDRQYSKGTNEPQNNDYPSLDFTHQSQSASFVEKKYVYNKSNLLIQPPNVEQQSSKNVIQQFNEYTLKSQQKLQQFVTQTETPNQQIIIDSSRFDASYQFTSYFNYFNFNEVLKRYQNYQKANRLRKKSKRSLYCSKVNDKKQIKTHH